MITFEEENTAKISIAITNAERLKKEAEAEKISVTAEKVNEAQAKEAAQEVKTSKKK